MDKAALKHLVTKHWITTLIAFLVGGLNGVAAIPEFLQYQKEILFASSLIGSFALLVAKDPNK